MSDEGWDILEEMRDWERDLFEWTGWIPGEFARVWRGKKYAMIRQRNRIVVSAVGLIHGISPPYWSMAEVNDYAVELYRNTELAFKSLLSLDSYMVDSPVKIKDWHVIGDMYKRLSDDIKLRIQLAWEMIPPSLEMEPEDSKIEDVISRMKGVYIPQKYEMYESTIRRSDTILPSLSWTWVLMIAGGLCAALYHVRDNAIELSRHNVPNRCWVEISSRKAPNAAGKIHAVTEFDTPMGTVKMVAEY